MKAKWASVIQASSYIEFPDLEKEKQKKPHLTNEISAYDSYTDSIYPYLATIVPTPSL